MRITLFSRIFYGISTLLLTMHASLDTTRALECKDKRFIGFVQFCTWDSKWSCAHVQIYFVSKHTNTTYTRWELLQFNCADQTIFHTNDALNTWVQAW